MKGQKTKTLIILGSFILIGIFFVLPKVVEAAAGINKQINFQGKVVNTDGTNVTNNSYNFLFCIYTTATPTTPCTSGALNDAIWKESKSLTVTDGVFQTNLGDATALPNTATLNVDGLYLGINFNSNGQMSPLVQFTAAPYAFNSDNANNLEAKTWEAPGTIGSTTPNSAAFTALSSTGITNLASTAGSTLSLGNSTGTVTLASGGVSAWTNTSGNLTIATTTSGTLALTSAGALNESMGAASTVTLANVVNALNFDANTLSIDALNNRIGIGTNTPSAYLDLKASDSNAASLQINSGVAPSSPNDGDVWYDGTHLYFRNNTTSKDLLASGGAGMAIGGSITSAISGSLLFANSSGQLAQDNTNLFWNAVSASLGIGTTNPIARLGIFSSTEQLRLGYDVSNYAKLTVGSDSKLTLQTSNSTQSMLTIGSGTAQNAGVGFDGNTNDYYMGMDDASDNLTIGLGLAIGTTPQIIMNNLGNVGFGAVPNYKLDVYTNSASSYAANFFNDGNDSNRYGIRIQAGADDASGSNVILDAYSGDGNIHEGYLGYSGGHLTVVDLSDISTKTNVSNTAIDGLGIVDALRVVDYARIWNPTAPLTHGLIAQEVQKVFPEMVTTGPDGKLGLMNDQLFPVIVKALQQIQAEQIASQNQITDASTAINQLKSQGLSIGTRVDTLEKEFSDQSLRLDAIKSQLDSQAQNQSLGQSQQNISGLAVSIGPSENADVAAADTGALEFIQSNLDSNQSNTAANGEKILDLNKNVAHIQNDLAGLTGKINSALDQKNVQAVTPVFDIASFENSNGVMVDGPIEFYQKASFADLAEFFKPVTFDDEVTFKGSLITKGGIEIEGEVVVSDDSAGYAIIKEGNDNVRVNFINNYKWAPIVSATLSLGKIEDDKVREATENLMLLYDVKFIVTDVTQDGFEIRMSQKAAFDVPFAWSAVSVKDPKTASQAVMAMEDTTIDTFGTGTSTSDSSDPAPVSDDTVQNQINKTNDLSSATDLPVNNMNTVSASSDSAANSVFLTKDGSVK